MRKKMMRLSFVEKRFDQEIFDILTDKEYSDCTFTILVLRGGKAVQYGEEFKIDTLEFSKFRDIVDSLRKETILKVEKDKDKVYIYVAMGAKIVYE